MRENIVRNETFGLWDHKPIQRDAGPVGPVKGGAGKACVGGSPHSPPLPPVDQHRSLVRSRWSGASKAVVGTPDFSSAVEAAFPEPDLV